MPCYDDYGLHQQGIQLVPSLGYVVSGSASTQGYLSVINTAKNFVGVIPLPPVDTTTLAQAYFNQYNHMGGFQIAGGILAVGCEYTESSGSGTSVVQFLAVSDLFQSGLGVESIRVIERPTEGTAGATGICAVDDGWIVVIGNYGSTKLDFFQFTAPAKPQSTDPAVLFRQATQTFLGTLWLENAQFLPGSVDSTWPSGGSAYQNINLFTDSTGLWMIGMGNNGSFVTPGEDWGDLYQVTLSDPIAANPIQLKKVAKIHFYCTTGTNGASFMYGSGLWLDQTNARLVMVAVSKWPGTNPVINQFPKSVPFAGL